AARACARAVAGPTGAAAGLDATGVAAGWPLTPALASGAAASFPAEVLSFSAKAGALGASSARRRRTMTVGCSRRTSAWDDRVTPKPFVDPVPRAGEALAGVEREGG